MLEKECAKGGMAVGGGVVEWGAALGFGADFSKGVAGEKDICDVGIAKLGGPVESGAVVAFGLVDVEGLEAGCH